MYAPPFGSEMMNDWENCKFLLPKLPHVQCIGMTGKTVNFCSRSYHMYSVLVALQVISNTAGYHGDFHGDYLWPRLRGNDANASR